MPSTITDRLNGLTTSVAAKAPCRVATTANITLSAVQTIDGITLVAKDRVLVKDQTDTTENGIWIVQSGAWTRAPDFDGSFDAVGGSFLISVQGTVNANSYWRVSGEGSIDIGTDAITFESTSGNLTLQDDLASPTSGKGASLVGVLGGGDVQDYIYEVSANAFGVIPDTDLDATGYPNSATDQAAAFQAAVDYADTVGASTVRVHGRGAVALGSTITVPFGISIRGNTSRSTTTGEYTEILRIVPLAAGVFATAVSSTNTSVALDGNTQTGFLFFMNVAASDTSTWIRTYPNSESGGISDLHVDGTETGGIGVAYFAGSHIFENIRCIKVSTLCEKPNVYTDNVTVRNIYAALRANTTDYLVYLPGVGDGYVLDQISSGYTGDQTGITKGIYIGESRGAQISGVINGIHELKGASGVEIHTSHQEGGYWIIDGSDVTFQGGVLFNGKDAPAAPIVIKNSQGVNRNSACVTINDVMFQHMLNAVADNDGWGNTPLLDIDLQSDRVQLVMNGGNRRKVSVNGQLAISWETAPMIGDSTGSGVFTNWKNFAPMLASQPFSVFRQDVRVTGKMPTHSAVWVGLTASSFTPVAGVTGVTYKGATGNNTYLARPLYDAVRLLGRVPSTTASVTIAVVNGATTLPAFYVDTTDATKGAILWEVLRDTGNDGNYDLRALVPGIDLNNFVDDGNAVNSFAWEAFGPGAADTLNNGGHMGRFEYHDGLLKILDSTAVSNPTVGTWVVGDQLFWPANAPDANSMKTISGTCRVAGAPGTWDVQRISTVSPAV